MALSTRKQQPAEEVFHQLRPRNISVMFASVFFGILCTMLLRRSELFTCDHDDDVSLVGAFIVASFAIIATVANDKKAYEALVARSKFSNRNPLPVDREKKNDIERLGR